ncbi:YbaN family protein [Xanthomonas sacchari]
MHLSRALWCGLGLLMLALGLIGAVLPVMPTTIFLILAAYCFSRSSPRLDAWLLAHPRYGAPLRLWREQGAITRRGKWLAASGMALGYLLFCCGAHPGATLALGVGALIAASAAFVLTRPAPRDAPPPR